MRFSCWHTSWVYYAVTYLRTVYFLKEKSFTACWLLLISFGFGRAYVAATLPSNNEERLIREILRRRGHRHKLSRPVVEEIGTIDVQFSVVLHQIVKVVRLSVCICTLFYPVSYKKHNTLYSCPCNFAKCWPTFNVLSPSDSAVNE